MTTDAILDRILIPRPNGGEGLERVATFIASTLERSGATVTLHEFTATPHGFQVTWTAALLLMLGSNGFGIEEIDGRRQHAMEWYFEFVRTQRIDVTAIITHRFPLEAYRDAFMTRYSQGDHSAVKVLFDAFPAAAA